MRGEMKKIWRGTAFFLILGWYILICKKIFTLMIFSVLLNEWGGGQQLEGVDTKDVLSSLEKGMPVIVTFH